MNNGTDYTFEVRAVNPVGNGAVSGDTATPNPRPDAPANFEAAPANGRVTLNWDDPSDSSITKYQYRVSTDDGTNWNPDWTDISGSGAATTSYTITPLDNGTEYTFEVRAVNPTGNGPASGDTATPNPVPEAPGSFNAAPDDRRVTLSWDDPSDSSITKYQYRVSADDGTNWNPDWTDISGSGAATTSYTLTPLNNGTDYTFEVRAVNPVGNGAVSSETATPNPRPVAPANFEAAPANRQVTLNWDDPRDNSIAKYQYRVSADGGTSWTPNWTDVPSSGAGTTTHTLTPLDNGTEYTFEVRAVNPTGEGAVSSDTATPNPRPAAPANFNAASRDAGVSLNWDDPGDSSITKYQHRYRKTRETNWDPNWTDITGSGATTTSHTITLLDNGTSYTFEVRAVNPVDNGAGARAAATPWPLPSAPRNLNAAPDDRRVTLSWNNPNNASITKYQYRVSADGGTSWDPDWRDIPSSGASTTTYTVTPLDNGTEYTFEVRAVNPTGEGAVSSDTATPNPRPAAPGSFNAAPDDRRVALSWDDPSDSSITKYQYRVSADDGTNWNPDWTDISGSGAATTSYTITPLDNGTEYTFEVRAVNPTGNGPASGDTATPNPVPAAPGSFNAAPDDRRVALSWDDPSDSSITKYQYRVSTDDGTNWNPDWTDISGSGAATTSYTITPLDNGTEYTFEVRAVNPTGNGPASGDTATPNPVPAAPGSFNAAPDDRRVALSWDDPSDSSITKYQYRVSTDDGTNWNPDWTDISGSGAATTSYTITPLDNGTEYTFEVRAVNPTGNGPASGDTATPNPVPAAPGSFNAAPDDRRVTLSWDDPSDSSITKYQYRVSADDGTNWNPDWTDISGSGAATTSYTLTPLNNGTDYTFEVRAVNPVGNGAVSGDTATPNPRPDAPANFEAAPANGRVTLNWDDPSDSSITKYQYRVSTDDGTNWNPDWTDISGSGAATTSYTITPLDNGTEYTFEVRAVNPTGNGPASGDTATPNPVPEAPGSFNAAPDDRRVTLSWDDPSDSSITKYQYRVSADDGTNWNPDWTDISGSGAATTSYTLTPLNNGTDYTFEVRAVNPVGNGAVSSETATPNPRPVAPANFEAAPANRQVTLNWDDPRDNSIAKYQYRVSADGGTSWTPNWTDVPSSGAGTTTHTLTPLDNGTEYTFEVRAVNPTGEGAVSSDTATPNPRPAAPANFNAASRDAGVSLNWDDPGDSSITKYQHRYRKTRETNWDPNWTDITGSGATTTSHTITLLDNGTSYTFEVRAVNPVDNGAGARAAATPWPLPSAPRNLNAAPDDRRVTLSWNNPNNASITKYQYRVSADGGTSWDPDWRDIPSSGASTTTYTVTPLDNGTEYTFEVRAVNPTGEGAVSSDTATPNPRPAAPGSFNAAPDDRRVALSWDDPSDSSITKYQYRVSADDGTNWNPDWTDISGSGAATTSYTITPLDNGTEYTFEVRAVNPTGNGPASGDTATPNPVPAAPGSFNAAPDDRRVALSWDDPSDSSITKYQYRVSTDDGTNWNPDWTDISGSGAATTSYTITPLDNGTEYTFEVRAVNPTGNGPASGDTATPNPVPAAPGSFNAAPDDRRVTLSWDDPSDSSITKYQYRVSADDGTNWNPDWTDISGSGATTTSHTVTPLDIGTSYTFEVRAVNPVGYGARARASATPFGPPDVPLAADTLQTLGRDGALYISWHKPAEDPRAKITSFDARYRPYGSSRSWRNATSVSVEQTPRILYDQTIEGLDNRRPYEVQVAAVNRVGRGPWATASGVPQADYRYGPPSNDGDPDLDLGPLSTYWTDRLDSYTFHPDTKNLNINVIENSCMAPATFRIFWDSQKKAAKEYEADIQTREGAGEFTHQFGTETFMDNNTRYEQGYIYGTASLHKSSTLSVRVRARFTPEGWSTWSETADLFCFETENPATSQEQAGTDQQSEAENSPATGQPTVTGRAEVGETLTASTGGIADPDGLTSATYSYQWSRDDGSATTDISGATASTYTLQEGDLDHQVSVTVSFTDDGGNDETLTSAAVRVQPQTPLSGAFDSATLPGQHDGSNAFTFELYFSEEPVLGFEDVRDHVLDVTNGDVVSVRRTTQGSNIRWEITVQPDGNDEVTLLLPLTDNCDDEGAVCTASEKKLLIGAAVFVRGPAASQEQTAANTAATGTPAVTGTAQVGETLTADTSGIADADGLQNATFSHQWVSSDGTTDSDIPGETGATYVIQPGDAGKMIRVRVSFTDDEGNDETTTSAATAAVAATVPGTPRSLQVQTGGTGELAVTWQEPESNGGSDVTGYQVQWKLATGSWDTEADVSSATATATSHTITSLALDTEYAVRVIATNSAGDGPPSAERTETARARASEQQDSTPNTAATGAPTISGKAQAGETLTADTSDIADENGLDNASFSYQWVSYDGNADTDIPGAAGSTYTLVPADEGKGFRVRVSFTDDDGHRESLTSALARSERPYALSASASDGAVALTWKLPVGWPYSSTFQILRNRPELGEAEPLVLVKYLQAPGNAHTDTDVEAGVLYVYRVKPVDPFGYPLEASQPVEIRAEAAAADNNPASGAPTISGTAQVGETLTADTSGIADEDGLDNAAFSYQWLADDTAISGATGSTYTLAAADEGKTIKVKVSFTDDAGNEETLTSVATASVAARPNSPATGAPTISGTVRVGETVTADTSGIADADGLESATFAYQWIANDGTIDADISGATESTYTLKDTDEGKTIRVRVSFTDDAGNEETLTSTATAAVAGAPSEPLTASLENTPEAHDGETPFTFELRFSEEVQLSYKTLRDHAFTVTGGTVTKAERLDKPSNILWRITVEPDSSADVMVVLPVTSDCDATGAICTGDGRKLSDRLEFTVNGPSQ